MIEGVLCAHTREEVLCGVLCAKQGKECCVECCVPNKGRSVVCKASLTFAIIRATNLCLRGSRVKWRSALDMVDGIGLPSIQE